MIQWNVYDAKTLPITLVIIVLITIILWLLLRKKSEKIKNIPFIIISVTFILLEIGKQIYCLIHGYKAWYIPMHFCSLALYLFPLASFLKKGRVKDFAITMSFVCSVWTIIIFYLNPSAILTPTTTQNVFQSYYTFHTFTYHHLIIFYLFLGIALSKFNLTRYCYFYVIIGFSMYAAVALPFAHLLNTNFCNLLFSEIPFLESIRLKEGQVVYTLVLYIGGIALAEVVCFVKRLIHRIRDLKV